MRRFRLREEVNALKNELLQMQKTHQEALSVRDKEIADLKASARDFQANIQVISDLKKQVDELSRRRSRPQPKKEK
jgi:hypothetical protein